MTFYNIRNIAGFINMVNECSGGIFLKVEEGQWVDIRNNILVQKLLEMSGGCSGIDRLDVYVENSDDNDRVMQYLIGYSGREKKCS